MTRKNPSHLRRIAHFAPYRFNNSPGGIRRAKRLRYKNIDQDINLTKDLVPVVIHWPLFYKDKFKYITVDGHRKGARKRKGKWQVKHNHGKDKHISQLPWSEVSRLRTFTGQRIYTVQQHMTMISHNKMRMMAEIKGDHRFADPKVAEYFLRAQKSTGCEVYIMTLQNLGNPHARLCNFHKHGFKTILLARGRKGVPRSWESCITYVRGKWRRA